VSLPVTSVCSRVITAGASGSNACSGDSGGAVLLGGALVAVVSGGTPDCSGPTTFTRTDAHANWIAAVIAGSTAQCASCVPPDPACGAATETKAAMAMEDAAVTAEDARAAGPPLNATTPTHGGGGCQVGRSSGGGGAAIAALVGLALAVRRRGRRPGPSPTRASDT
jgi:hypothetical protein